MIDRILKITICVILFCLTVKGVYSITSDQQMSCWDFDADRNDSYRKLANFTNYGTEFKEGISGTGIYFDGDVGTNTDHMIAEDNAAYDALTTQITLNLWMNTTVTTREGIFFMADNDGPADSGPFILESRASPDDGKLRFTLGLDTGNVQGLTSLANWNNGSWHMATFTWSANTDTLKIYQDGVWVQNVTATGSNLINLDSKIFMGCLADNDNCISGFYWNGTIDEVTLWNRTLSDNDILDLYNGIGFGCSFPEAPGIPYIINSTWNVTGAVFEDEQTAWRTDPTYIIRVTDPTPSVYFATTRLSNASCYTYDLNFTAMLAANNATEAATSNTSTHICTLPSNAPLVLGPQNISYSVANASNLDMPPGQGTSSSGRMAIYLEAYPQINTSEFSQSDYSDTESIIFNFVISDNNTEQELNYTVLWYLNDSNVYNDTAINVSGGNYSSQYHYSNFTYPNKVGVKLMINNTLGAETGIMNQTILETEYFNLTCYDEWNTTVSLSNISTNVNYSYHYSNNGMIIFNPLFDHSGSAKYNLSTVYRPLYNMDRFTQNVTDKLSNVTGSYCFIDTEAYLTNTNINTSDIGAVSVVFTANNQPASTDEIRVIGGNGTGAYGLSYVVRTPLIGSSNLISFVAIWKNATNYTKYVTSNISFSCETTCADAFHVVINFGEEQIYAQNIKATGDAGLFSNRYKSKEETDEFKYETGYSIGAVNTTVAIFNGSIYDVRLFNKTLTTNEIIDINNHSYNVRDNLLASYPFIRLTTRSGNNDFFINSSDSGGYLGKNELNTIITGGTINESLHQSEIYVIARNATTLIRIYNATFTENKSLIYNDSILVLQKGSYNVSFNKTGYTKFTRNFSISPLNNRTEYFNLTYNLSITYCTNVTAFIFYPNLTSANITINVTLNNDTFNRTTRVWISDYNATLANQTHQRCAVYIDNPTFNNYSISMYVNNTSPFHNMSCNPSNNDITISLININETPKNITNITSNQQINLSCWGDFIFANTTFPFNVTFVEETIP